MKFYYTKFPLFDLGITLQENFITKVDFLKKIPICSIEPIQADFSDLANKVISQLDCYLATGKFVFDLPLMLSGSNHTRQVLLKLLQIPAGFTKTYGSIALELCSAARAVGVACRRNEIPLFIPCHRVIGKNNNLTGFMGSITGHSMEIKSWLLQHEGCNL